MACTHERIKCVNCVKYCIVCGAELPADFTQGKDAHKKDEAVKTPENGQKTATKRTSRKGAK